MEIRTESADESIALGIRIGRAAPSGGVIAFSGDLGAGKTTLARGIARGLGIDGEIGSPTFAIVSEHEGGRLLLRHIDAYRLRGDDDFHEIGGDEMLGEPGTLALVEWSEKIPHAIGKDAARLDIRVLGDGSRLMAARGAWLEEALS